MLTIVGYAIIAVITVISMVQGHASFLTVRLAGAGVLLIGSALLGVIIFVPGCCPGGAACCSSWLSHWAHVANAIFGSAENLLLALLWGSMGIALLSRRKESPSPSRRSLRRPADFEWW